MTQTHTQRDETFIEYESTPAYATSSTCVWLCCLFQQTPTESASSCNPFYPLRLDILWYYTQYSNLLPSVISFHINRIYTNTWFLFGSFSNSFSTVVQPKQAKLGKQRVLTVWGLAVGLLQGSSINFSYSPALHMEGSLSTDDQQGDRFKMSFCTQSTF